MVGFFTPFIFIGFAYITPLTSKLYKELFYSVGISGGLCGAYIQYYRLNYLYEVDKQYDLLKDKFELNPQLALQQEDRDIIKNFGMNRYNYGDEEEDIEFEEDERELEMGIFDGTVEMEQEETRGRIHKYIYG